MKEGYNLVMGINTGVQGEIKIDLRNINSYVITSLDYLLDHTAELLNMASAQRNLRDYHSSVEKVKETE